MSRVARDTKVFPFMVENYVPAGALRDLSPRDRCPLMCEDRLGGVTCLYRLEEVGSCYPDRCGYFQKLIRDRDHVTLEEELRESR